MCKALLRHFLMHQKHNQLTAPLKGTKRTRDMISLNDDPNKPWKQSRQHTTYKYIGRKLISLKVKSTSKEKICKILPTN